ncbi:MAG: VCBS repeat-containing protein, partial [Actinomycetota bacterium]|nr:VCBS repeat-containing protein [Actinomycetota bacterium]
PPGEIYVKVSTEWTPSCNVPNVAGCGGTEGYAPGESPFLVVAAGKVWIAPRKLDDSDLQNLLLHEMGHAVGLVHYEPNYEGLPQVMRADGGGLVSAYRSGDLNGFRYLADNGFRAAPFGGLDSVAVYGGGVLVRGWAIDQHTKSPIEVELSYGARKLRVLADDPRPDVDAAHPAYAPGNGEGHGFAAFLQAPPGTTATVCVTAVNVYAGSGNRSLGCKSAAIPAGVYFADGTGPKPEGLLGQEMIARADAIVVNPDRIHLREATANLPVSGPREWSLRAYYGELLTTFTDVDADGDADVVAVNDDHIGVRRSTGSAFEEASANWSEGLYFGEQGTHLADVTGDKRSDLVVVNDTQIVVRASMGNSFSASKTVWRSLTTAEFGDRGIFFADATGDGRADAISITSTGIRVYRSSGSSFGSGETWTEKGFYGNLVTSFADVTGDGRADAIAVNTGGITVRASTGNGFVNPDPWAGAYYGTRGTYFADIDGDKLADAIVVNDDKVIVRRSNGTSDFLGNQELTTNPYYGTR